MNFKEKVWQGFEKFMDFGDHYRTDNYKNAEERNRRRNPGGCVGLALVIMVFPELVYLYNLGKTVAMGLMGIGLFLAGILLDLFFIYAPIEKKYPSKEKKVDRYNHVIEFVIFIVILLFTLLRFKLGLYLR